MTESSEHVATADFTVDLAPGEALLDGTQRLDGSKTWTGGLAGTGRLVMLSGGDPRAGSAGYVALETFDGTIDGRRGRISFLQRGILDAGAQDLDYRIVPGSGSDGLAGLTGRVELTIDDSGHHVRLHYRIDA